MRHRLAPAARLAALGVLGVLIWGVTGIGAVAAGTPAQASGRCALAASQPPSGGAARAGHERRGCLAPESPGRPHALVRTLDLGPAGALPTGSAGAEVPAPASDDRALPRAEAPGTPLLPSRYGRAPPPGGSS
ncbi:MAG TPA: hypothetical protein VK894_09190 [Jiangellales bacterium]|nr:hypothetical protein [Jiangellales bacterium]